jgi:hypothetical protein
MPRPLKSIFPEKRPRGNLPIARSNDADALGWSDEGQVSPELTLNVVVPVPPDELFMDEFVEGLPPSNSSTSW